LKLKIDLHCHTSFDLIEEKVCGRKGLIHPKELIDAAIAKKFDAISITHHGILFHNEPIERYAKSKGLLLIPGVESYIDQKHILLINFSSIKNIHRYEDLCRAKNDSGLIVAPHPFYMTAQCIGRNLIRHIDCFDAIESSHFYFSIFNPNKKAQRVARHFNLPVIGNSDTHLKFQFGTTYSLVEAEEKSIPAIIKAIKQGKVECVSHPLQLKLFVKGLFWSLGEIPITLKQLVFRLAEAI